MKRTIKIEIDCYGLLCSADAKSKQCCPYVGTSRLGTIWLCRLFPSPSGAYTVLDDDTGWLMRCQACLDADDGAGSTDEDTP